ncbi:SGNH/GDSL hydrolase family protein [Lipingzhangella sp. LS1_29]|uniref:SGNH/GDSL hydrolase family protein n=1 Tax=Lipingzhangella rawalii TaxID=2055835 RepID=A0ABU2HA96_9ACTN|nr:GDSL-type esterase/lipase family protein [Lipingzhangella rawalii]MDS1272249.1 SGNH/GDSL hydrolase family protein [Lipingzhangella rawalii]
MHTEPSLSTTPVTAALLRGSVELETTKRGVLPHRLPARARAQCSDPLLAMAEAQPSGVRLALCTSATHIELDALPTKRSYRTLGSPSDGVYELWVDGQLTAQASVDVGNILHIDVDTGAAELEPGAVGTLRFTGLPSHTKDVEIWLPHNETTELVALRSDAPISAAPERGRRVWLHHGSSISHGSNATTPTGTWPAVAATLADVELVNLGLSGSAQLDAFTARTLRDIPADAISLKLGINLVNADLMRMRAFTPAVHGFLDTIREGQPATPLLVVSPLYCPIHEDTPGPCVMEASPGRSSGVRFRATGVPEERAFGKLTLSAIREELARIVEQRAAEDPNLYYLDGRELYGAADCAELPMPDDLHPDGEAHRRIGERFAKFAFGDGAPLGATGG